MKLLRRVSSRLALCTSLFGILLLGTTSRICAQSATGKIVGRVTDPSGAVLANANITITNTETLVSSKTTTDSNGDYQVQGLPIGSYRITAEHTGFSQMHTDAYTLQINQEERIDIKMKPGGETEVVDIRGDAAGVDLINSTIGGSVTSRPIVNLPLNGRQVLDLALLQPGVMETNTGGGNTSAGTFNIAGGRSDSVTFLLDGGINNNLLDNGVVFNPNPDAVAEFRILENSYGAEYGRNAGGIITVVTKSGTNNLHGSVFEFLRNGALDANAYFNKRTGTPRDILRRNQFGFTLGGPVVIPPVVHGKDKFFWFFSYQGQRQTRGSSQPLSVFTPAELNGDFSGSVRASEVAAYLQANPFFQPNPAKAAQGIIDPARINSVAKNYIKAGLVPSSATGNLVAQAGDTDNRNEFSGKFDFTPTASDKIGVTLARNLNPTLQNFRGTATAPGYPDQYSRIQHFASIDYAKIFTPKILNDFHFTAQRLNSMQAIPVGKLPNPADLGVGVTPDDPTGPTRILFAKSNLALGFSGQGPTALINNTFAYTDTLSWTKGRHNLKFGGDFTPYQNNTNYDFFVNGEFDFDGTSGGIGTGFDFADFILGLPDAYGQFGKAPSDIRGKSSNIFGQDEWRIADNLTLTFGLRYEYSSPKIDTQGRSFSLALGQQSTRFVNAPLGLVFPGDKGVPKGANFPDKNDFAPRIGFAWDPLHHGQTSIRGGFGVYYDILKGEDNLQFNGQAPFFGFASLGFDPLAANPTAEVPYLAHPFLNDSNNTPNSFPSKPPSKNVDFAAAGFLPAGNGGVYFVDPHLRTPYVYQYSLGVQQALGEKTRADLTYVGSDAHKLTSLIDVSPFVGSTRKRLFNMQPGLQTFPGTAAFGFLDEFKNVVNANYNSLQASITRQPSQVRWLGTAYYTLAYTWSKSLDNASGFRERNSQVPSYNTGLFYAASDFDLSHRVSFSGGWDLPVDRLWKNGMKAVTNGWSLYPVVTWHTGFPLDLNAGYSQRGSSPGPSGAGDSNLVRLNLLGNSIPLLDPRATNDPVTHGGTYFLPTNFSQPPIASANTYGTVPRNFFRGPGYTNTDLAVAKSTHLFREGTTLEFRAEFFNLFNHAQFLNPSTTFGGDTFGQVTATHTPREIQFGARIKF